MNSMRGLFFIIKGQYTKGAEPSFLNEATGGVNYIGGYDPESEDTEEWYMLIDNKTFMCQSASADLDKVLGVAHRLIKRHKGDLNHYIGVMKDIPRGVSSSTKEIRKHIFNTYGDYYRYEIEEMEDLAYRELREEKPINKNRKLVSKIKTKVVMETSEKVIETHRNGLVKPKIRVGVKKISSGVEL